MQINTGVIGKKTAFFVQGKGGDFFMSNLKLTVRKIQKKKAGQNLVCISLIFRKHNVSKIICLLTILSLTVRFIACSYNLCVYFVCVFPISAQWERYQDASEEGGMPVTGWYRFTV